MRWSRCGLPRGVRPAAVRVTVGKRDVTKRFDRTRATGSWAWCAGSPLGRNVVRATAPRAQGGASRDRQPPNGGPVFSGPQTRHYRCQEGARDAQCNQPARYTFLYKSTDPTEAELQPYDPDTRRPTWRPRRPTRASRCPSSYAVRTASRTATATRSSRSSAPARGGAATRPQRQWNHKVLVTARRRLRGVVRARRRRGSTTTPARIPASPA